MSLSVRLASARLAVSQWIKLSNSFGMGEEFDTACGDCMSDVVGMLSDAAEKLEFAIYEMG